MTPQTHRILVVQGDITRQHADVIVNAANSTLLGGGGVDGAIHHAAGPELLQECQTLGGCPTGQSCITRAYRLPAKWIVHTVGPVWRGGGHGESELLASCYRSALLLADQHEAKTVAFPSISTGAYGFPVERAAQIAIAEIAAGLETAGNLERATMVCFDAATLAAHQAALEQRRGRGPSRNVTSAPYRAL